MGLASWMRRVVAKASSINTFFNINVSPTSPMDPRPLTIAEALSMKALQSTVFACVDAISQAFQEAQLSVWETSRPNSQGKTESHEIPNHPALDPFTKNPWLDESDIERYMVEHLELGGAIYLWKWMSGAGVEYVWPLPPSWVIPVPQTRDLRNEMDPSTWIIEKYCVYPPGKSGFELTPDEVVYIREIDPNNLWGAVSPLVSGSAAVDSMKKGNDAHLQQLESLKTPGLILHTAEDMTEDQRKDLQSVLKEKLGSHARKNALILSGEKTRAEMLTPMAGFGWDSMRDFDEIRICQALRVPPIVAGCWVGFKNSPWSNTEEAWRSFYQHKMVGRWKQIARGLTRGLLLQDSQETTNGKKLEFRFNTEGIKYLQDDIDARADRAIKLFHGGLIKRNEALELAGQTPLPKNDEVGNERVIPMNLVVVGAEPEPALPAEEHLPPLPADEETIAPDEEIPEEIPLQAKPKAFNPDQPRDDAGRFGEGTGGASTSSRADQEARLAKVSKGKVSLRGIDPAMGEQITSAIEREVAASGLPPLGGVEANAAMFSGSSETAAAKYDSSYNRLFLNPKVLGSQEKFEANLAASKEAEDYLRAQPAESLDERTKEVLSYDRQLVDSSIQGKITHELGHHLEATKLVKQFPQEMTEAFKERGQYTKGISAYASLNLKEYVAESYVAYRKGGAIGPAMKSLLDKATSSKKAFDPNQPRDESGRFGEGSGGGKGSNKSPIPQKAVEFAMEKLGPQTSPEVATEIRARLEGKDVKDSTSEIMMEAESIAREYKMKWPKREAEIMTDKLLEEEFPE